jgi:hypothetical protein
MSTFAELTDSTLLYLSGFSVSQDQATHVATGINDTVTSVVVGDATAVGRGLLEIEDELLWVDSVNTSTNTLTIAPYGRGYRSTTAATHAANVRVVSAPLIPRKVAKDAINDTIQSLWPDLYGVATTTFTYVAGTYTYSLPAGAEAVLQVEWQDSTTATEWLNVRRYDVNLNASTAEFASGNSITILDNVIVGRTVRVVYSKQPTVLSANTDVFATVTGLPASCEDVVRLGAAAKLVPFLDIPHLAGSSAEADFGGANRQVSSVAQASRYLLQMYQIRLEQEKARMGSLYPVRVHYTN